MKIGELDALLRDLRKTADFLGNRLDPVRYSSLEVIAAHELNQAIIHLLNARSSMIALALANKNPIQPDTHLW